MKTTARINLLPPDLRAIAEDMLAVKFPEPEVVEKPLSISQWIHKNSTSVGNTLTDRNLQDAFDTLNNMAVDSWAIPKMSDFYIDPEEVQEKTVTYSDANNEDKCRFWI